MSDAPPATPVDKNKQRLRKNIFGFLNIFGFNTETSDTESREDIPPDANIGSGDSGSSNSGGSQNNSRRTSISRESCGEAASQPHGKQPECIVKGSKGRGNMPVPVADGVAGSHRAGHGAATQQAMACAPSGACSSNDVDTTATRPINISSRCDSFYKEGGSVDTGSELSGSNTSKITRGGLSQRLPQRQGSLIRTCPIPERLRMQLIEPNLEYPESRSPTITPNSARMPVDSSRTSFESYVNRRSTIGGSSGRNTSHDSRRNVTSFENPAASGLFLAGDPPLRTKTPDTSAALARSKSSTHSSWSAATPASEFGPAVSDDPLSAVSSHVDYASPMHGWDQQQQHYQQSPTPFNRGAKNRRYSVFDLSFASQRPGNSPSTQPNIAPLTPDSSSNLRKRLSRKSTAGSVNPVEVTVASARRGRKSSASSAPLTRPRQTSHSQAAMSSADNQGSASAYPIAFEETLSSEFMTMFSSSNNGADDDGDDLLQASGSQTPGSERGSIIGQSHQQRRRLFSTNHYDQDSSSGQSTPNQILFTRMQHNSLLNIKLSGPDNMAGGNGAAATMSTSQQSGRTWRGPAYADYSPQLAQEGDSVYADSPQPGSDADDLDTAYLRMSTSVPDLLFIPMVSCVGGQKRAIKRPDYSYEHMLAVSRNTKARRWKQGKGNVNGKGDMEQDGNGSSQSNASASSSQLPGLMRRTTSNTIISRLVSVGCRGFTQQQETEVSEAASKRVHTKTHNSEGYPFSTIVWVDWIDEIPSHSRSAVVQHVVSTWKGILRSWHKTHRGRVGSFNCHRRGSSTSHVSRDSSIMTKSPIMLSARNTLKNNSSVDFGTYSPSSVQCATVMIDPYLANPTHLQRGISESGRHASTSNAFSAIYQMATSSSLGSPSVPNGAETVANRKAGPDNVGSILSPLVPKPSTQMPLPRQQQQQLQVLAAPHRRLSVIKGQELTSHRNSGTSTPQLLLIAGDNFNCESPESPVGSSERSPWMIAKLDDPNEAVELLLSFQQRLRARLSKAKAESEQELVKIIQDLSEFVEEGLSYVNEDLSGDSDSYNEDSVTSDAGYSGDEPYASEENAVQIPGLDISARPSPHLASNVGTQQKHMSHAHPGDPAAAWELKSINRRLQDVLSLHGDGSATYLPHVRGSPNPESGNPVPALGLGNVEAAQGGFVEPTRNSLTMSQLPRRVTRSPSIRRITFLRALSGEDNAHFNAGTVRKSPAGSRPHLPSDSNTYSPREVDTGWGYSNNGSMFAEHTCALRRPATAESPLCSDYFSNSPNAPVGGLQLTLGGSTFQSSSEMPFPCLKAEIYLHNLEATSGSVSPGTLDSYNTAGRRCSSIYHCPRERSLSQTSVYSSSSSKSMLTAPLIAEDEFKPTPFLAAIMDLVSIIGHVLGLSAEDMLRPISGQLLEEALAHELENGDGIPEEECQHTKEMLPTEYLAQRLDILGNMWEQSLSKPASPSLTGSGVNAETSKQQPWPCRGLFFRALLAISSLNRIVMWYVAVVSTYSDNIVEELGRRSGLMPGSSSNNQHKEGVARANATEAGEPMSVGRNRVPNGSHMLLSDSPNAQTPSVISRVQSADKRYLLPQYISDSVTSEDRQNTWQGYQASHPPRWYGSTGPPQNTTAVDKGLNMLLEVGLDERIRYISPTCRRLLDTDPTSLIDQQAKLIFGENDVPILRSAVEQLLADSTRTVEMNVQLQSPNLTRATIVEAKGMLIYDRLRNKPSHVLWVLRYLSTVWPLSQRDVPADDAIEAWSKTDEPPKSPSLMETITCRICDREIPEAYFEEHTWLCAQSHRAAMDVEHQNDRLSDIRAQIQAWYPGCHIEELEDLTHGGTDVDTLRSRAQQKATDIGNSTWQKLLDESSIATQSMAKMCLQAMALDDADAVPKCEWGAGRGGKADLTADVDFVRSNAWVGVANYRVPRLRFRDLALEALGKTIVETIANKLSAIDDLQYAIVESSEAYSKWVLPEDSRMALDKLGLPGYPSSGQAAVMGGGDTVVGQTVPTTDSESDLQRASALPCPEKQSEPFETGQAYVQNNVPIPSRRQASISSSTSSTAMGAAVQKASMSSSSTAGRMGLSEGSSAFLATPTMPSINDFTLLKPISKGAYGSVFLAKKRTTGDYYAIKILKKADMIAKNQISNVKAERAIMMAQTGSPFVVRLLYTFQSRTNLYLVMDYLNGGDCASLIKTIGALPLDWARQYLAEVVLGIGDLHGRNVVHRDLKPDNLLIDSEGHLKLTDFGLSKLGFLGRRVDQYALHPAQGASSLPSNMALHIPSSCVWQEYVDIPRGTAELQGQASAPSKRIAELREVPGLASAHAVVSSIADASSSNSSSSNVSLPAASQAQPHNHALGTPDYIAPESILGLDSGKSVDWWALGVICYEFLFGIPPFHDDTPEMVFRNILSAEVDFYDELREQLAQEGGDDDEAVPEITPEARDFITRLLCRDPRRRLGYGGASEVKAHAFFYGVDWTTLLETQPAFVPQTESMEDTEYFDARGATLDLGPEADSIAECGAGSMKEAISRSLEELSVTPEIGQSAPLRRQNTVPLPLPKSREYIIDAAETADNTKPRSTTIDENPEFGTFTFKNLHALEKANMDELYKLRRRNTMLDTPSSPLYHPETRSPFGYGSSSDSLTVPPPTRRNRSQTEHSPLHFELPPFKLSSSTGWHGAHDPGHSQYHRGSLLNPGANVSSISSHNSHSSNHQPSRTSEYFPDFSLPPTPRKQDPVDTLLPPSMGHTYSASRAIVEPDINNEYLQSNVCLVADDNPVCCKIMDIVLRRLHLDCIVVRNGAEAIRCAMGRTVFRAIFMDMGMPIVDGDEATRMIKSTYNANKETPIIGMVVYEGEATEALYDGTIVKPVTFFNVKKCLSVLKE